MRFKKKRIRNRKNFTTTKSKIICEMKKIFYIKKHIKFFQTCEKLSKITKISTKLSKKVNEIQYYFSKKLKKKQFA